MTTTLDAVELKFCDLCGCSIPQKDLDQGLTRKADDKMVGACCLAKLLEGKAPRAPAVSEPRQAASSAMPLLFVGIILILGVLAAAFWVDQRAQDRDPGKRLAALEGKLAAVDGRFDAQDESIRKVRGDVKDGIVAEFSPRFDKLSKSVEEASAAAKKPSPSLRDSEAIKARIAQLARQVGDLTSRQSSLEGQIENGMRSIKQSMTGVERAFDDLRRRGAASAAPRSGGPISSGPTPKIASLPEKLGKKVDELGDADPGVRWAALDELVRSGENKVVPYILPALKDADPFVRRLCAEGLATLGSEKQCGALIQALADNESIVREAAYKALLKLSNEKIPFDPEASAAKRTTQVRKWQSWWDKKRRS